MRDDSDAAGRIRNGEIYVQLSISSGILSIEIGADDDRPVLRRTLEATGWTVSRENSSDASTVTLAGDVPAGRHCLTLRLPSSSRWLEITETLSPPIINTPLPTLDAFEAEWHFADAGPIGEVFSQNLVPEPEDLIGEHMFRAPVLVVEGSTRGAVIAVDVHAPVTTPSLPKALNLLRTGSDEMELTVGLHAQEVRGHVFHRKSTAVAAGVQLLSHRYFVTVTQTDVQGTALAAARSKAWSIGVAGSAPIPLPQSPAEYARDVFPPVLDLLWAERDLDEREVGAVTVNRSYDRDVWFSTWMNPLRSSYALFHFGETLGNDEWMRKARTTRALANSAPMTNGLFPTVFDFTSGTWTDSHHQGGGPGVFHLSDMSWTMYQLLRWHQDLEADPETIERASVYARMLATVPRTANGGLPAYVDSEWNAVSFVDRESIARDLSGRGGDAYIPAMLPRWDEHRFVESGEDGASLLFLAELAGILEPDSAEAAEAIASARRIASFLGDIIIPSARWTDFEVYFSCSPKPIDFHDHRSGQGPQNTLAMHHAAAGLLRLHELTGDPSQLALAQRVMDRLSLYQQVWSPVRLGLSGFGGYGVMNTDGEWNDARQAQFAQTHHDFARVTGESEHDERAVAAARAGMTTTFLPISADRYSGWWREPLGMAAENHGHNGTDQLNGASGFDWGSGSGLATLAYFERHSIAL